MDSPKSPREEVEAEFDPLEKTQTLCGIIIDDTIKGVRSTFLEQGVDPLIIQELKQTWKEKLQEMIAAGDNKNAENLLFGDDSSDAAKPAGGRRKAPPPALPPMPKRLKAEEDGQEQGSGKVEADEKKMENVQKEEKDEDEESLSSLSDSSGDEAIEPTDNLIMCQFDSVKNTKAKWKVKLRSGLANLNGKEYSFDKCNGDLKRW